MYVLVYNTLAPAQVAHVPDVIWMPYMPNIVAFVQFICKQIVPYKLHQHTPPYSSTTIADVNMFLPW